MRNKKIWMLAAVTASVMAQPMTAMAASFPYMQKNGVQVIVGSGNASDWKQILGNAGVNVGSLSGGNWQEQLNQLLQNCDPGLQDSLKDCPILGGGQGNLGDCPILGGGNGGNQGGQLPGGGNGGNQGGQLPGGGNGGNQGGQLPGGGNGGDQDGSLGGGSDNQTFEAQVLELVNHERAQAGLQPLSLSQGAASAADVRARELTRSFSHTRPDGRGFQTALTEAGVSYTAYGENIAYGQNSPQQVMNQWMNSAGHRANILNPNFTAMGVGHYENASGTDYWVQLFIR